MKKKKINNLKLNKKTISSLDRVKGGRVGIEAAEIFTRDINGIICRSIRGHCEDSLAEGCECSVHVCQEDHLG